MALGGGISVGNNYLLDGFPITDVQNRASASPSIEALEDVKVQVHTYDAEMGRTGGGMFNATAKSGTNRIQGGGFLLMRPGALIGQNFFLKLQGRAATERSSGAMSAAASAGPIVSEQDVLLGRGRGLPRRPVAERQPARAHRRRARRRFLGADRLERPADHHLRSAHDRSGDRRAAAVSRQPHSGEPDQRRRCQHREVSAAAEYRQYRASTTAARTTSPQSTPNNLGQQFSGQSRSPFQRQSRAERRLSLSIHRGAGDQLLSDAPFAQGGQNNRPVHVGVFNNTYVDELVDGAYAALRVQHVRRHHAAALPVRRAHAGLQPRLCRRDSRAALSGGDAHRLPGHQLHRRRARRTSIHKESTARSPSSPARTASRWAATIACSA